MFEKGQVIIMNDTEGKRIDLDPAELGDSPEMIAKCLNCEEPECFNCLSGKKTKSTIFKYFGELLNIRDISKKCGTNESTLRVRIKTSGVIPGSEIGELATRGRYKRN